MPEHDEELNDCHKCVDGSTVEDDDYLGAKFIICSFCLGHEKVYFGRGDCNAWVYLRPRYSYPNEYRVREVDIWNQKMTIQQIISDDVEFHERKGLTKKEALDKIQNEFKEKRELLEREKRILYRDIIKERIREHEAELAYGPQASFKDIIMSKERKAELK